MNFARDVLERMPADRVAVVERTADGGRREHTAGALAERSAALAGRLRRLGAGSGRPVVSLLGSRVEWVETMLACFRIGAPVLAASEQLRTVDLSRRFDLLSPAVVVADERDRAELEAASPDCPVLLAPDASLYRGEPAQAADLAPDEPCLLTFTSGTAGPAKAVVHAQRYLAGQQLQATHWLDARPGDLVWCTAAPGWSKSARNSFVAAWLRGASALLHDARFDPDERLAVAAEERVAVWCMSPTEWRMIARRGSPAGCPLPALRSAVAAGEPLDVATLVAWRAAGVEVRDGYGQTETGQVTANPAGTPARPGSMGRPLPGVTVSVADAVDGVGELVVDPESLPTFFLGYLGEDPPAGRWRTGDRVRADADGYLYFVSRADDVIVSAGYRIGPTEVEEALARHPAVADCAVVAAPDPDRGHIVRAVVVPAPGYRGDEQLARELQAFAQATSAPYAYPRRVDFVRSLPRTSTGKLRRAELRGEPRSGSEPGTGALGGEDERRAEGASG